MPRVVGSDTNYSTSGIARRTGLTRREVEQLRSEGRRDIEERGDLRGRSIPLGIGEVQIGEDRKGQRGASVSALGFGVEMREDGGGSISFPGGMSVEFSDQGCYIVQVHKIFGQEAFSNIQKKPGCDDDNNDNNDDDSNNNGGGNKPKPPYCLQPNGRPYPGRKGNENLLPECLDDGLTHTFYWQAPFVREQKSQWWANDGSPIVVVSGTVVTYTPTDISRNRWTSVGTQYSDGGVVVEGGEIKNELTTTNENETGRTFIGTLREFKDMLKREGYVSRNNYEAPPGSQPTPPFSYTHYSYQEIYVMAVSPSAIGRCNPTGTEGCDDTGSGGSSGGTDEGKPQPATPTRPGNDDNNRRRDGRDDQEMDRCCANTKKIAKALAVDEILDKGFVIPNRLMATKARGTTKLENYLEVIAAMVRIQDHLGIHPIEVEVKDSNNSQEGDQHYSASFVNATAAVKQIIELNLENKGDSADRLGILFRIAWINVQILNAGVKAARGIQGVMQFLGMPIRERVDLVDMPFDVTLGKRSKIQKGFKKVDETGKKLDDKKIREVMELRDEDSLEAVLPQFLNSVQQPVTVETFKDDSGVTLLDMLRSVMRR